MAPLLRPPVMYQSFGTNVDADYPFVLSRESQLGSSNGNDNFQTKSRTYANSNVHTNSGNMEVMKLQDTGRRFTDRVEPLQEVQDQQLQEAEFFLQKHHPLGNTT
ncbi:hypothetical protein ACFXTO_025193 [Malus domestica]